MSFHEIKKNMIPQYDESYWGKDKNTFRYKLDKKENPNGMNQGLSLRIESYFKAYTCNAWN